MHWLRFPACVFLTVLLAEFAIMLGFDIFPSPDVQSQTAAYVDAAILGGVVFVSCLALEFLRDRKSWLSARCVTDAFILGGSALAFEAVLHMTGQRFEANIGESNVDVLNALLTATVVAAMSAWLSVVNERSVTLGPAKTQTLGGVGRPVLVGALFVTCCLTLFFALSEANQRAAVERTDGVAALLDVAGRQRMLSQRIGRLALIDSPEARQDYLQSILMAESQADQMNARARAYIARNQVSLAAQATLPGNQDLERARSQYLAAARAVLTAGETSRDFLIDDLQRVIDAFLPKMESAVAAVRNREMEQTKLAENPLGPFAGAVLFFLLAAGALWPLLRLIGAQQAHLSDALSKTKDALREIEAQFDLSIDLLCVAHPDGRFLKVSKAFEEVLGYSADALTDTRFFDLIHPDDHGATQDVVVQLAEGHSIKDFPNRYRGVDGAYRHLEWHARLIDGKIFAIGRDISEKIERQLLEKRARAVSDIISAMHAEMVSSGSVCFALTPAVQSLIDSLGGQAGFVCALDHDENGDPVSTILAMGKSRTATNFDLWQLEPELSMPAELTLSDPHKQSIARCLATGYFFDGYTSAQLGGDRFTGIPIIVGSELFGVLALDEACAAKHLDDRDLCSFISALGELLLSRCDFERRRKAEESANKLARLDPLTGLGNRRALAEEFEGRIDHEAAQFALVSIDLDRFKPINDVHGHMAGDEVLRIVAQRLRGVVRGDCAIIRLGGDEFAILTEPWIDTSGVSEMSKRILETLTTPISVNGLSVTIGASLGVATYPIDADNLSDLLQFADAAMYRAKEHRGEVQFFDPSLDQGVRKRAELEVELRAAIEAGEIVPYFQPVVCLQTGAIVGHEVLSRWHHPQRGFISPALFIPIAEKAGLIEPLFWQTLKTACDRHMQAGADTVLSVNISPVQTKDPLFAQRLLQALTRWGFPASRLEVEVTETAMIADTDSARAMLLSLKNQGVHIALDDFGTGYSSLVLLRDLPIDKLKIDRSFVNHVTAGDSPDAKIIEAILAMAQALKLEVTAEGIETEAAARALREKGCQFGQGYLFSAAQAELVFELRCDRDQQIARVA